MSYHKSKKKRGNRIKKIRRTRKQKGGKYTRSKKIKITVRPSYTNIDLSNGNKYPSNAVMIDQFDIENNISKIESSGINDPGYPRKLLHHLENSVSIVDDAISKIYIDKNYPKKKYPILKFGELDIDVNK
jgi:hypothetical protein